MTFSAIVDDLWFFVEVFANAVSAKFLYNGISCIFSNLLASVADVAECGTWSYGLDAGHHAGVGDVNQALGLWADLTNGVHAAGVAVVAVFFDGNVDVEDVAVFQGFVVGYAVADDVIDGGAAGFGVGWVAVV